MNEPIHFNPKWWITSALFFGFIFFLTGFFGVLMERQNLFSDTVRFIEKAGSYTALKESIKGLNPNEAVPVWRNQSEMNLIFCYPAARRKLVEWLRSNWTREYSNFSKLIFYPIQSGQSWDFTLDRIISEDQRSIFIGFRPEVKPSSLDLNLVNYTLYLRIPSQMINSFQEEIVYASILEEKSVEIYRKPADTGLFFKITWEAEQKSKAIDTGLNLPETVTGILARLNMMIYNGVSLH